MKSIKILISTISIFAILFASFWFYQKKDFWNYLENSRIYRSNTQNIPSEKVIRLTSVGHQNTYANFMWIGLIQYIGDNISRGGYTDFSLKTIERIAQVSPKFHAAYEWALWLMPIPQRSDLYYSPEEKKNLEFPLQIAYKWMQELCDTNKIQAISSHPLSAELWGKSELKNPCKSDMLAYLIAFYGGQLMSDSHTAQEYYKIAGMQEQAPSVSQILAVIATAPKDDPKTIALNFFLMAMGGYDDTPNSMCYTLSTEAIALLQKNEFTTENIAKLQEQEKNLVAPKARDNMWQQSCYDMAERGAKYTYLAYMTEMGKQFPELSTAEEIIAKTGLSTVPTTQSQENFSMKKTNGAWEYYQKN